MRARMLVAATAMGILATTASAAPPGPLDPTPSIDRIVVAGGTVATGATTASGQALGAMSRVP